MEKKPVNPKDMTEVLSEQIRVGTLRPAQPKPIKRGPDNHITSMNHGMQVYDYYD